MMEMSVVYLSVNPDNKTIKSMRKNMLTGKELRRMFIDNDIDGLRQCVPKEFIGPLLKEWDKAQEQKQRIIEEKRIEPFTEQTVHPSVSGNIDAAVNEIIQKISDKKPSVESFCDDDIDDIIRDIVGDLDHCEQISKEDIATITRRIIDELDHDELTQEEIDEISSKVAASIARLSHRGQQPSPASSGFVPSPAPVQEQPEQQHDPSDAITITGSSDDLLRERLQEQTANGSPAHLLMTQPTDGAPDLDPPPGKTFAQQVADEPLPEMLPDRLAGERFKQSLDQQVADLVAQEKYEPPQPAASAARMSDSATNQQQPQTQDGESLVDKVKEEQRQLLQPETQPVTPEAGFTPAPQGQPTPDVAGKMRGSVAAMDSSTGIGTKGDGSAATEGAGYAALPKIPFPTGDDSAIVAALAGGPPATSNSCFLKVSGDLGRKKPLIATKRSGGVPVFHRGMRGVRH